MNPYESSRHKWQHLGTAQYVRIEIRPPRRLAKGDNRHTAILEWLPDDSSEAYQTFHALIDVSISIPARAITAMIWTPSVSEGRTRLFHWP